MKNLVLGMVKGYTFEQIRPFVATLRATGFPGDIVLIHSNIQPADITQLAEQGVGTVSAESLLRSDLLARVLSTVGGRRSGRLDPVRWGCRAVLGFLSLWSGQRAKVAQSDLAARGADPHCARYPLYFLYLNRSNAIYDNVLLSDVRDVLFQKDIFESPIDGIGVSLEDGRQRIKDCRYNSNWIRSGYGERSLRAMSDRVIACSGVTFGPYAAIMEYLETMIDQLQRAGYSPGGMDQGVHNYMLYNDLIPRARVFANGLGPVMTMGRTVDLPVRFDERGRVLNTDGSVPCVLHQYDRHIKANRLKLEATADAVRLLPQVPG